MKLETGKIYDQDALRFTGWSNGETDIPGYSAWEYFGLDSRYLGPDSEGIEPEFETE